MFEILMTLPVLAGLLVLAREVRDLKAIRIENRVRDNLRLSVRR